MATSLPLPATRPTCFCFSLKYITPDFKAQPRRVGNVPDLLWMPPTKTKGFRKVAETKWYYWCNGAVSEVPSTETQRIRPYSATSMVWSNDRQAFLHVPCDCTEVAVEKAMGGINKDVPLDWAKITFHHRAVGNRCLSLVGYDYGKDQLGATGSPSWMPELLPQVYQYDGPLQYQGYCLLAGDISVLLSLAAFSIYPEASAQTIGELLCQTNQGTKWRQHGNVGQGRLNERGVVVRIGLNPDKGVTADHLRAWEQGRYGPILH